MRFLFTFLLACLPLLSLCADNVDDVKKQINKIKKDNQYIYAESTAPTEADARSYAESKLYEEVNEWVATRRRLKKSTNLIVNNRKELWTMLSMPRGNNMYRSFIYVKKSDILPTENGVVIANTSLTPGAKSVVEPVKKEVKEPVVEVAEGTVKEAAAEKLQLPEVINQIAACTKYGDMADKVKQMKADGRIKDYARYASLVNPDKCYLVIYNREGKVVAVLTPGPDRRNVKTGQADGVKNYSGCGAIGLEL